LGWHAGLLSTTNITFPTEFSHKASRHSFKFSIDLCRTIGTTSQCGTINSFGLGGCNAEIVAVAMASNTWHGMFMDTRCTPNLVNI